MLDKAEVSARPHVAARGFMGGFDAEETGLSRDIKVPLTAFRFSTGGPALRSAPPKVGADTENLLESLGYDPTAIADLRRAGVGVAGLHFS